MERYEIEKKIGAGAQATAYLAHSAGNPKELFVLKRLPVQSVSVTEMGILYKLKHPAIIRCHEAFTHDGDLFLVLQYADGGDLEKLISSAERRHAAPREVLPAPIIDRMFIQLCLGLQECHAQRTLHRDIKTANIFLSKDMGRAMLGDFGVAKELAAEAKVSNTMVGTPMCFSPETVSGAGYSFASDIWALGCVLYEMLTFRKPFPYSNLGTLVQKVSAGEFDPLPNSVPGHYRRIIKGMLTVDPNKRYSVQEVLGEMSRKAVLDVQSQLKSLSGSASGKKEGGGASEETVSDSAASSAKAAAQRRGRRHTSEEEKPPRGAQKKQSPHGAGRSADDVLAAGPLRDWVKWKQREFEEIESFLRLYDDDDVSGPTTPPPQNQTPPGRTAPEDDEPPTPHGPAPPRTPPEGQMNANRARRMLPSPQVLQEKQQQKRPNAVGGLPPGDVAVRPLNGGGSGGARPEQHDDPVNKASPVVEAAAARREREARRAAERAELHKAIAAGRNQALKPRKGEEPEAVEPPRRDFPAGGGHNVVRHLSPAPSAEREASSDPDVRRGVHPQAAAPGAGPSASAPNAVGANKNNNNGNAAADQKKKRRDAEKDKDRGNVRDMIKKEREKAQARGGNPGGNFDVEIVLPGNLQHLLPNGKAQ